MKQQGFTLLELTVVLLLLIALTGVVLPYFASTAEETACQATDATLAALREAIVGGASGPGYSNDLQNRLPYYRDAGGNESCADDTATGGTPRYHLHFLVSTSTFGSSAKSLCPKSLQSFHPSLTLGWRGPYAKGAAKLFHPESLDDRFDDFDYVHIKHTTDHREDLYFLDQFRWRAPVVLQVPPATADCPTHLGAGDGDKCARLVSAGPDGRLDTQINDVGAASRNDDRVVFLFVPDPSGNRSCIEK